MIDKITKKRPHSSGCFLPTMTRDLSYEFKTKKKAEEAVQKLIDAGFDAKIHTTQ